MKIKEKESLRNMTEGEINNTIKEIEKKLFHLKFKKVSAPLENPIEIRFLRRKIAFLKTILSKRKRTEVKK